MCPVVQKPKILAQQFQGVFTVKCLCDYNENEPNRNIHSAIQLNKQIKHVKQKKLLICQLLLAQKKWHNQRNLELTAFAKYIDKNIHIRRLVYSITCHLEVTMRNCASWYSQAG